MMFYTTAIFGDAIFRLFEVLMPFSWRTEVVFNNTIILYLHLQIARNTMVEEY